MVPRKRRADMETIDVPTVHVFNNPVIPAAADVTAPGPLPSNLAATVPSPFPFIFLAFLHSPVAWFALVVTVAAAGLEFWFVTPHINWILATIIPLFSLAGIVIVTTVTAIHTATSLAIVIQKDHYGRIEVDEQLWWRFTEARKWSNAWRKIEEDAKGRPKRRVIMVDASDYWQPVLDDQGKPISMQSDITKLRPFISELARRPVRPGDVDGRLPVHAPSPAELGTLAALGAAVKISLDIKDAGAEILKLAAYALVVGLGLTFMFMGGGQVADSLKQRSKDRAAAPPPDINATVTAALRANNLYILPSPIATQIPVPGIQPAP